MIKVGSRKPRITMKRNPSPAERNSLEYSRVPPSRLFLEYKPLAAKIRSQRTGMERIRIRYLSNDTIAFGTKYWMKTSKRKKYASQNASKVIAVSERTSAAIYSAHWRFRGMI